MRFKVKMLGFKDPMIVDVEFDGANAYPDFLNKKPKEHAHEFVPMFDQLNKMTIDRCQICWKSENNSHKKLTNLEKWMAVSKKIHEQSMFDSLYYLATIGISADEAFEKVCGEK